MKCFAELYSKSSDLTALAYARSNFLAVCFLIASLAVWTAVSVLPSLFSISRTPMKVKCDIHPWMNAYVAVVEHPYFAVTGEDGSFKLENLPPGSYTIEAWHENYEVMEQTITIGDNESKTLEFTYGSDK